MFECIASELLPTCFVDGALSVLESAILLLGELA